ncbi:MAG TPA: helix-turn-helix domain-containing protein [Vicinamibacterales bacterium]|nr:helix-turn-helix domain-containing protein [Vicinamibacterales bacterium]
MSSRSSIGRILDTALALITKRGNAHVTMAQIAKAARVSRQAVYLHFADRAALMLAVARHVDEKLGLPEEIRRMSEMPTAIAILDAMVSMQARLNPAIWAVARGLDAIRRTDAAAEQAWQDRLNDRLEGCRAIVARLQSEGSLRAGLDSAGAADLLWTLTSLRMWEDLVLERRWSAEQYKQQLTRLLRETLTSHDAA